LYRKPSATVGALFVVSLTLLLLLLNRDAVVLSWLWSSLGPYVGFIQQMMGYVIIVCFGTFAMRSEGIAWRDLGLTRNNFILALPLLLVFVAGIVLLVWLGGGWSQTFKDLYPSLPLAAVAFSVALIAFSEEYVFRGFVQIGTRRRFGVTSGVLVSAAVFALVHIPTDLARINPSSGLASAVFVLAVAAIGRFAFGSVAFSYMYQFTGNLFITIFTHAFYDFSLTYLVVAGGTLSMVLLYLVVPFAVVLAVYYAAPFQGLHQSPSRPVGTVRSAGRASR
jgi:membrane protease YdiL (CAAX protease family)